MYDIIHNSYPTQTRRHSGLPPRTQSKHSDNAVNALYLSVRTQAATKKYISAALDRLNHFDLRRVKPQSLAPPSASVQARNVTRLRFEFQGARARRHRRRHWRAPAGSRPGARRSFASSMVKGRELRGLYGTKRLLSPHVIILPLNLAVIFTSPKFGAKCKFSHNKRFWDGHGVTWSAVKAAAGGKAPGSDSESEEGSGSRSRSRSRSQRRD